MTDNHDGLYPVPPRILDFYIVGGPKCGTTSLFDWLSQHPGTRCRILILEEEMSTDPAAAIAMLLDFLGLEPVTLDLARQNTAVELQSIRLNRLIRKLRAAVERLRGTLGMDVFPARSRKRGTGLLRLINRFNLRVPAPGRSLDPALRGRLARYFAEDVALLRATLDQPIPAWTDWPVRHA